MRLLITALRASIFLLVLFTVCPFGVAQSVIWSGELDEHDGQFNRTNDDGTIISFVGTNVFFDVQPFFVSTDGAYDFESSQPEGWDGMIFVYSPSFDPKLPLKNWAFGDDGYVGSFTVIPGSSTGDDYGSRLGDIALKAGVQYIAVTTSFYNYSEGEYVDGIGGGPGVVRLGLVPEPVSIVPLAVAVCALRRRRAA